MTNTNATATTTATNTPRQFAAADTGRLAWFVNRRGNLIPALPVVGYITDHHSTHAAVLREDTGEVLSIPEFEEHGRRFKLVGIRGNRDGKPCRDDIENAHGLLFEPLLTEEWRRCHSIGLNCQTPEQRDRVVAWAIGEFNITADVALHYTGDCDCEPPTEGAAA